MVVLPSEVELSDGSGLVDEGVSDEPSELVELESGGLDDAESEADGVELLESVGDAVGDGVTGGAGLGSGDELGVDSVGDGLGDPDPEFVVVPLPVVVLPPTVPEPVVPEPVVEPEAGGVLEAGGDEELEDGVLGDVVEVDGDGDGELVAAGRASHLVTVAGVTPTAAVVVVVLAAARLCGANAVPTMNAPPAVSMMLPAMRPTDSGRTRAKHM